MPKSYCVTRRRYAFSEPNAAYNKVGMVVNTWWSHRINCHTYVINVDGCQRHPPTKSNVMIMYVLHESFYD